MLLSTPIMVQKHKIGCSSTAFCQRRNTRRTLSSTVGIIVENFLQTRRQQYLLQNFQQSSLYRSYHSHIPSYLHDRPRSIIIHCLDRRTNSAKILANNIHEIDGGKEYLKSKKHLEVNRVDFGISNSDKTPTCTCKDWLRHHIPCKHFFGIFTHRPAWQWDNLPSMYLQSAYLSTDTQALHDYFQPSNNDSADPLIADIGESTESNTIAVNLPKSVSNYIDV